MVRALPAVATPAEAAQLKEKADAAFDGRDYAHALEMYRDALAQGGDPRIHYNMAQTLTALERYPEALVAYQRFLSEAPAGTLTPQQQDRFFALLDELKGKITRLEIRCDVPGARVLVRATEVGTTPLREALSVNAGPARVEVIAEGFKPFAADLVLSGGSTQSVDAPLERTDFTSALTVKSSINGSGVSIDGAYRGEAPLSLHVDPGNRVVLVRADGYEDQSRTLTMEPGAKTSASFFLVRSPNYSLAYVGFGVAITGIVVGSVTGILAFTNLSSAEAQCDNTKCGPSGQPDLHASGTYGVFSTIAFPIGAAGLAVGIYGLWRAQHGREAPRPVEIVLRPGGAGLEGTF
jgi:hypothetical protein